MLRTCRILALVAVIVLPASSVAEADEPSGNDLHRWCQGESVGLCNDEIDEYGFWYSDEHCVPEAATFQQIVDVVKLYLVNHPERRHLNMWQLIGDAVDQAWPC